MAFTELLEHLIYIWAISKHGLLIKADLRINTKGKLRFGLGNEHQLTDRISFDWRWNTEKEYTLGLSYAITKQLYISGNYDSRERFGLGLALRF